MSSEIRITNNSAPRSWVVRRALPVLLLLASLCAIWFERGALLRGAAELWTVSDTVGPADAVVIFGGGLRTRPFAAAKYYREGLVHKILISNVRLDQSELIGGVPSHTEMNRMVLLKLGVPDSAIETLGAGLSNTYQEAVALHEWALKTGAHNVIVPTEDFSSRRVRWVVRHELAGTGINVEVPALHDPTYSLSDWWNDERALVEFQNEVLKYVYYRLKY